MDGLVEGAGDLQQGVQAWHDEPVRVGVVALGGTVEERGALRVEVPLARLQELVGVHQPQRAALDGVRQRVPPPGVVPPGRLLHDDAVALDARDGRVAVGERRDAHDLDAVVRGELGETPERGVPEGQALLRHLVTIERYPRAFGQATVDRDLTCVGEPGNRGAEDPLRLVVQVPATDRHAARDHRVRPRRGRPPPRSARLSRVTGGEPKRSVQVPGPVGEHHGPAGQLAQPALRLVQRGDRRLLRPGAGVVTVRRDDESPVADGSGHRAPSRSRGARRGLACLVPLVVLRQFNHEPGLPSRARAAVPLRVEAVPRRPLSRG